MGRFRHTREHRGARVLVTMQDGSQFRDVFVEREKSKRFIVLQQRGRVPMRLVKNVAKIGTRTIQQD